VDWVGVWCGWRTSDAAKEGGRNPPGIIGRGLSFIATRHACACQKEGRQSGSAWIFLRWNATWSGRVASASREQRGGGSSAKSGRYRPGGLHTKKKSPIHVLKCSGKEELLWETGRMICCIGRSGTEKGPTTRRAMKTGWS